MKHHEALQSILHNLNLPAALHNPYRVCYPTRSKKMVFLALPLYMLEYFQMFYHWGYLSVFLQYVSGRVMFRVG